MSMSVDNTDGSVLTLDNGDEVSIVIEEESVEIVLSPYHKMKDLLFEAILRLDELSDHLSLLSEEISNYRTCLKKRRQVIWSEYMLGNHVGRIDHHLGVLEEILLQDNNLDRLATYV